MATADLNISLKLFRKSFEKLRAVERLKFRGLVRYRVDYVYYKDSKISLEGGGLF